MELTSKAVRRGPRRGTVAGGEQGFYPRRSPARGLTCKRVESSLDDRQCAVIGLAYPGRLPEHRFVIYPVAILAGDASNQPEHLSQLRDLAAGIGA